MEPKTIHDQIGRHKRVVLSSHARERMYERGISEQDVLKALKNPTQTGLLTVENRTRVRKNRKSNTPIDVVFTSDGEAITVITAMTVATKGIGK
ncbi:MAG: DUF4258 domain-containing protein [Planctomycetaceae bacterium]